MDMGDGHGCWVDRLRRHVRQEVSPRRDLLGDDPCQQRPLQVVLHEGPVHGGPHVAHCREAGCQVVRDDVRVKVRAAEVLPGAAGHIVAPTKKHPGPLPCACDLSAFLKCCEAAAAVWNHMADVIGSKLPANGHARSGKAYATSEREPKHLSLVMQTMRIEL